MRSPAATSPSLQSQTSRVPVEEVASGIDSLYLSGRTVLSDSLWDQLLEAKQSAQASLIGGEVFSEFGGELVTRPLSRSWELRRFGSTTGTVRSA